MLQYYYSRDVAHEAACTEKHRTSLLDQSKVGGIATESEFFRSPSIGTWSTGVGKSANGRRHALRILGGPGGRAVASTYIKKPGDDMLVE